MYIYLLTITNAYTYERFKLDIRGYGGIVWEYLEGTQRYEREGRKGRGWSNSPFKMWR